jgi:hypothetical protein
MAGAFDDWPLLSAASEVLFSSREPLFGLLDDKADWLFAFCMVDVGG